MATTTTDDIDGRSYVSLTKDDKSICRARLHNHPSTLPIPDKLDLPKIYPRKALRFLDDLPHCFLQPAAQCTRDHNEWVIFLTYLHTRDMVATGKVELAQFYVLPPVKPFDFSHVRLAYRMEKQHGMDSVPMPSLHMVEEFAGKQIKVEVEHKSNLSPRSMFGRMGRDEHACESTAETHCKHEPRDVKHAEVVEKNYVRADPSYLQTLSQAHSGWIFGGIAELIDNSKDAKASKLDISIDMIYWRKEEKRVPMLSVVDNGHGMTHTEIKKMMYFGHKPPDAEDPNHIGRFGIGFKTGAMRLGRDALVITQTANSRSIAFLSQSLNEGNDNLEIPVISYHREGQFMEVDQSIQSKAVAKYSLKAIKKFSPFDKYFIGEKTGLFGENDTGTQIYIWNLDKWGTDYCLEWCDGLNGGSSFHQGDILIRSKRIRSRPGQISQKVPLDYSLRSYLELIFLDPRMKIYVQNSLVKSRPLAKSLSKTCVVNDKVMGKPVQLTLGRSQLEWEQANSGIFLYWHGRLIEAYKRVGGMIHNGDMGRGVIGVIDVTDLMTSLSHSYVPSLRNNLDTTRLNAGNGQVWVLNHKQGFQDSEAYARLEEWLGQKADEYWDKNFDTLQLTINGSILKEKTNALYKPDHEWVQCDKCRKWRMLPPGFDSKTLPQEWFCYMKPFTGSCNSPEQKADPGVVTVSAKRKSPHCKEDDAKTTKKREIGDSPDPDAKEEDMKRERRGPSRACKKLKFLGLDTDHSPNRTYDAFALDMDPHFS
ncbi:hypothetical protein ACFE04_011217 [Oxalis oulophora]